MLLDLADPGARRVGTRTALDLLRGGWATRWREHPPLGRWLAYRFDQKIPRAYREWAADDIDGFWYPVRRLGAIQWLCPYLASLDASNPDAGWFDWRGWLGVWAGLIVFAMVLVPGLYRETARRRHLAAEAGEPLREGLYVAQPAPRPRVTARAAAPRLVLGVGAVAVLSVVAAFTGRPAIDPDAQAGLEALGVSAWLTEPPGLSLVLGTVLVAALGIGLRRARSAARRCAELLPHRPAQPHRVLTTSRRSADVWTVIGLLAVAADAWLEGTGRWPLIFSPLLAVGSCVTLPRIVALVRYRDPEPGPHGAPGPAPLTWSDLRCAATMQAVPTVDQPLALVRPYAGTNGAGGVVEPWPWRVGPAGPPGPPVPA